MADAPALGAGGATRGGSNPLIRTSEMHKSNKTYGTYISLLGFCYERSGEFVLALCW